MTESTPLQALLVDSFTRIRELVVDLTDGLTEETATYRADPQANTHRLAGLARHPDPG